MSDAEHERIRSLLANHKLIKRTVEEIPGGVKTTTTVNRPDLIDALRTHVWEMTQRVESNRPVRRWDPVFNDVFANAASIDITEQDIPNGIVVTETTADPQVVPIIRAHAKKVSEFAAKGAEAAAPPWAGMRNP